MQAAIRIGVALSAFGAGAAVLALGVGLSGADGGAGPDDAVPGVEIRSTQRADQLPRSARALKGDRLVTAAVAARQIVDYANAAGSGLPVTAYAPEPASPTAMIFSRVMAPAAEVPDVSEDTDDAMALAQPPVKPDLHRDMPLPPVKPALATVTPSAAARASLVSLGARSADPAPTKPSFFASLGMTPLRAPDPAPQARLPEPQTPKGMLSIPSPFGVPYVVQTERVETACLKPGLIGLLRKIESHYGEKVVITSGARSTGRDGSLHKSCEAADIIVPNVSAEALAAYARTIPDMGGVGTYCHPSMIHVDIGTPRNWHYGCGRSRFAMRGSGGANL